LLIPSIILGFFLIILSNKQVITQDQCIFWLALVMLPLFLFDTIGSVVTGESFAKGMLIQEEKFPFLHILNLVVSLFLLVSCFVGVIFYW
jgi:hypothetical protein